MHILQQKLLKIIDEKNIYGFTLRDIGKMVEEKLPQKIKHHLSQLERKGFILVDRKSKKIIRVSSEAKSNSLFVSIPILGSANCGSATIYADQNIEGHLKVSKKFAPHKKNIFAIRAEGNSLNKADIKGKNIETGDYVIIDSTETSPHNGDYIISIIDDMANIKKYRLDRENKRIALLSESTQDYPPIFIHQSDNFRINGKVVDVIKKF